MKNIPLLMAIFVACTFFSCTKDVQNVARPQSGLASQDQDDDDGTAFMAPFVVKNQKTVARKIGANSGGYLEHLPSDYSVNKTKKYPLLIAIHGAGQVGDGTSQIFKVAKNGVPGLIQNNKFPASFKVGTRKFSFIVISPQFIKWPSATDVAAIVDYAAANYRVDKSRIYVTGLSMGASATFDYATYFGKKLAAVAPMSNASPGSSNRYSAIAQSGVAVWAFHNQGDPRCPYTNTVNYVNGINGSKPVVTAKKTIYPGGGHNSWGRSVDPNYRENGKNMYEWMLSYKRK